MSERDDVGRHVERVLGTMTGAHDGPTLVVLGGVHGNEPAGLDAAARVLAKLTSGEVALRGSFVALAGNRAALADGRRFVDHDLNRAWTRDRVDRLDCQDPANDDSEDAEQRELLRLILEHRETATGPVTVLDLHTTSAGGPPFCIFSDTLENRAIAMTLGIPSVLGLEECIDGTMLDWATQVGLNAFVVEGGQHTSEHAVDYHEAAIWLTLMSLGQVDAAWIPHLAQLRETLRSVCRDVPQVLEVRYRHPVSTEDQFRMRPGYIGFQPLAEDETVADDRRGPVKAPDGGRILMPLYQEQGEDGFFVVREVRAIWLRVSGWLRRMRVDAIIPLLPGVRRHPLQPDWLVASRRVAAFYTVEVFHLAGFRTREMDDAKYVFARRRSG